MFSKGLFQLWYGITVGIARKSEEYANILKASDY